MSKSQTLFKRLTTVDYWGLCNVKWLEKLLKKPKKIVLAPF
jgi:hypothetical protein